MNSDREPCRSGSGLDRQFGHPAGRLGWLVGHAMALEHRALHRAVVARLALRPDDEVLEIGFGPGTAIRLASTRAAFVAGVDPSKVMHRQAERRNRAAVAAGRVGLHVASASALPFEDARFTVVFEVNSFHHWDDPARGLSEALRVLRVGGRILLALRATGHAPVDDEAARVENLLAAAGFCDVAGEAHHVGQGGAFVTASR
jgi:SAM-dependent methyltransferase